MLNPELAGKKLETFAVEDAEKRQLERIGRLPSPLRSIAYGVVGRKEDGKEDNRAHWWEHRRLAGRKLSDVSDTDRLEIFHALAPALADNLNRAWCLHDRLPYQNGEARRAFRAPGCPERSIEAKCTWLYQVLQTVTSYDQDVVWYAAWVPYIGWSGDCLGIVFAAAIDTGGAEGEAVFDTLVASAKGEHEIGAMGRHVTRALLTASRPDGWEFMEKYLLAAQRQEGLRQVVLETIDEAHPEAFRRMLHLILDHDLLRFSATLRAMDVWFGFGYDVETLSVKAGNALLAELIQYLEDPAARRHAIGSAAAQSAYLALCAAGYQDAPAALDLAAGLLEDASVERRYVGVKFLGELDLDEARRRAAAAMGDADFRVAWHAFQVAADRGQAASSELFEDLERFIKRVPAKPGDLEPIVWPWNQTTYSVQPVARALFQSNGERSPRRILPYLPLMDSWSRAKTAEKLGKHKPMDAEIRRTLFSLIGDTQSDVRDAAIKAIENSEITPEESKGLEKLLTRKAETLRRGVLTLLLKQSDEDALASADRLVNTASQPVRQAGLELLREMIKTERHPLECRAKAAAYREQRQKPDETEDKLLEALLDEARELPTLENGLGLFDPSACTPVTPPRAPAEIWKPRTPQNLLQKLARSVGASCTGLRTEAPAACLKSLQLLLKKHQQTPLVFDQWDGQKTEQLIGDVAYFPLPNTSLALEDDLKRLPGREIWEAWETVRSGSERDPDGFELLRLSASLSAGGRHYSSYGDDRMKWAGSLLAQIYVDCPKELKQSNVMNGVLLWLLRRRLPDNAFDFLLDAVETTFALIPEDQLAHQPKSDYWYEAQGWRGHHQVLGWLNLLQTLRQYHPSLWREQHDRRLWQLLHWMDRPAPGASRLRPDFDMVLQAFQRGDANEADLFDQLIGPRKTQRYYGSHLFQDLHMLTGRKPHLKLSEYPGLGERIDRCRDRILDIELSRGEMPTAASLPAASLRSVHGIARLAEFMRAYGHKEPFIRSGVDNIQTRRSIFSHIIRSAFPLPAETASEFSTQMQDIKAPPDRLVELAMFAPQWAAFVQAALGWPELEEAIWWVHAHTKDQGWTVDAEIREEWTAAAAERTPLAADELVEGAVDVAWFRRVYEALGLERWSIVDAAAKFASGGGGHKRAQLFADAMLGRLTEEELMARITGKRNADAVRALGLLPVPCDEASRRETLLRRYRAVQEFLRTSRQFGAMRQESEKKAGAISLTNLARSAGYPDPNRLQWAMEAEAVADLADGSISQSAEGITVTLAINMLGKPELTVEKGGKPLKTVPPKIKKLEEIATLFERKKEIERQGSRMRLSLEQAMCRGDAFTAAELAELLAHPVLQPMLRSLVFVGTDDPSLIGYPARQGTALEGYGGECVPLAATTNLKIAHPYDILQTGEWHLWQRECFLRERIQPFKQLFRELYVLTEAEQKEQKYSVRYEGHQVMPQRAMALAGSRGWVNIYEEGVRRTFHSENITAWITFDRYFTTPAEVEGLTVQQVYFTKRGDWKPLDLCDVPAPVFSEAMRDIDLIVSVAHAGGIDPEASASTVEMREALLRETLRLLKIDNVRFQSVHALINGTLGDYSIHMGSAVVHRQPGGHLCIVPAHGQHRGRLFLPFADDDPKTAEVVSKVLLLAKDKEIKDPTILEQILPRR